MNIQRFTAPTSREALAKARLAFGEGTLILSNRPTATGVEVVATGEDTLASLDRQELMSQGREQNPSRRQAPPSTPESRKQVEADATQLSMSTLSFQDYVRERMLRRRQEAISGKAESPTTELATQPLAQVVTSANTGLHFDNVLPAKQVPLRKPSLGTETTYSQALPQGIVDELQAMKTLIDERFNTLTWLGQARQNPIQSNMMLKMIRAGYSPTLSRTILERMPEETGAPEAIHWIMDVLQRNLKTDESSRPIQEEGGIYALVGATGVGKTTTAAKLAGLCAQTYGPSSVGLITLDTYRVGAHEQLRSYGRMLGVVAHLAHDRAALQDLLNLLASKKMILVDTTGFSPHDPRKRDMLEVLDLPKVNRLLVLNSGSHGDTLDDIVSSFKTSGAQQAILSKIDEASKLGPALDSVIRHQLVLRGVTTGQKVPEDWQAPDAAQLVRQSMRSLAKSAFDPKADELGFFFTQPSATHTRRLDA